ncbi:hypothetical protein [Streptomyces sp. HPF1205]|uniref:hypothetical protein n=1 Tax=Streptomyces sp. HPF1205 TaxID=2873262 RepID=UPI001CEC495F|nr:hypothetical protein [Streptomyces sp. HPF1205]
MPSLRTALALTVTAAAAGLAAAPAAVAAPAAPLAGVTDALPLPGVTGALPTQSVLGALDSSVGNSLAPVKNLTLDPLSGTGTDPLDNAVGSQVADFRPVSTALVTGPITRGGSLSTLPLIGKVLRILPG